VEFRYTYARPLTYVNCHVAKFAQLTVTGYTTPLRGHRPLPVSVSDVTYLMQHRMMSDPHKYDPTPHPTTPCISIANYVLRLDMIGSVETIGGILHNCEMGEDICRHRATMRPHFSGHVLIFKADSTVREEFIRLRRMSGNWVYSHFILLLSF
jgi:hypothetical protein